MIRETAVAGRFYEAEANLLRSQIDGCFRHRLGAASTPAPVQGRLAGFIAPHAGYMFSGPVASHAFERLARENPRPQTIIILGPKHTHYGADFSISAASAWKTPLGALEVDAALRDRLLSSIEALKADNDAHAMEHSVEVQLPFIQHFMPGSPRILPIALHYAPFRLIEQLASEIAEVLSAEKNQNIMLIASSDFSHDTPREEAYRLDREVVDRILALDAEGFYRLIVEEDRSVCGLMPITALLTIFGRTRQNICASLLKYATSMDIMRHERGVGYASIIFEEKA